MATRYSWFLTSFGTPIRTVLSLVIRPVAGSGVGTRHAVRGDLRQLYARARSPAVGQARVAHRPQHVARR